MTSEPTDRALRGRDLAALLEQSWAPSSWWVQTKVPHLSLMDVDRQPPLSLVGVDSTPQPSLVGGYSASQSQNWPAGPSPPTSQGVTLHMSPPGKQGLLVMKLTSSERVPSSFWLTSHPVWLEPRVPCLEIGVGCPLGRTR